MVESATAARSARVRTGKEEAKWVRRTRRVFIETGSRAYLRFVSFPEVVRQIVLYIVGELLLVLGVQPQHFHEAVHVNALEVAVGQCSHVAAGFDHDDVADASAGSASASSRPRAVPVLQVNRYVATDEVSFT